MKFLFFLILGSLPIAFAVEAVWYWRNPNP